MKKHNPPEEMIFMKKNYRIAAYSIVILITALASILPETLSGSSPFTIRFSGAMPPGGEHLLGTDYLGRDILSRTLIGGRISIVIGIFSRAASIIIGLLVGLCAALSPPAIRAAVNSVTEVFLSIPSLLLAMALAMVLGEGYLTIVIAIAVGTWAPVARFVSTQAMDIYGKDFVTSARALGAGHIRIAFRHILPSLMPLLIPLTTTGIATSIMMESTLSFLGLAGGGSISATPSWGLMIQEGSKFIFDAPWIILPPSILLSILILCFNQIGDIITGDMGQ